MINKEQLVILCEEALAGTDRFLVEVKVKPNNVIEVYIDSDTAVNIDHCAELSRFVNEKLDRDVEDYELSVLSWGLSGALKMDRQLQKYVGKDVEVKTKTVTCGYGPFEHDEPTFEVVVTLPMNETR